MPRSSKSKVSARGKMASAKGQARASSVGRRASTPRASGRSTPSRRRSVPRMPTGGVMPARVRRVYEAAYKRRGL